MPRAQQTLSDSIFNCLKSNIEDGTIKPGTVLRESDLARLFNVSRIPVSKAVHDLLEKRFLEKRPAQGYVVAGLYTEEAPFTETQLIIPKSLKIRFDRQPSWEKIYGEIESALVALMPFGSFKINESSMTEYYGVNRSIIQQVVTRLCERGIAEKPSQSQCTLLAYDETYIRNRYELRCVLEPVALERAAPFIPQHEIEAVLEKHKKVAGNFSKLAKSMLPKLERELHFILLSRCPNPRLLVALEGAQTPLIATTKMIRRVLGSKVEEPLLPEHIAVLEPLAKGDAPKAAAMLLHHLEKSTQRSIERLPLLSAVPEPKIPPYLKPR